MTMFWSTEFTFRAVSLQIINIVSCHPTDILPHLWKTYHTTCNICFWYVQQLLCTLCSHPEAISWKRLISGEYGICSRISHSHIWTNQSLYWLYNIQHCHVTAAVLMMQCRMQIMFKNISVVKSTDCSARSDNVWKEHPPSPKPQLTFQLTLFLSTFSWAWWSLVIPLNCLQFRCREMGPCLIHFKDAVKKSLIFMLTMTHMQSGSFHTLPHAYLSDCMVPTVQVFPKFCMKNLWMVRTLNLTVKHTSTAGLYLVVFPHMRCRPQKRLWAARQLPVYVCCIPYHL